MTYDKTTTDGIKQKTTRINDKAKRLGRRVSRQAGDAASDSSTAIRRRGKSFWSFLRELINGGGD
jgi:hypothetical protein